MKTKWIMAGCAMCFVLWACEKKLIDLDIVPNLAISTGEFDVDSLMVTSEIFELGEGVIEHGHVWAFNNNPTYENNDGIDRKLELREPDIFSSQIEGVTEGNVFFYRAFAKDRLDCMHYGDIIEDTIPSPPSCTLEIDFEVQSTTTCSGYCVKFVNDSKNAIDFVWEYGDGNVDSSIVNPEHTYANEGTYNVKLTAIGQTCTLSVIHQVQVIVSTIDTVYTDYVVGKSIRVTPSEFSIAGNFRTAGSVDDAIFFMQTDHEGKVISGRERTTEYMLSDIDLVNDMTRLGSGDFAVIGTTKRLSTSRREIYFVSSKANGEPYFSPIKIQIIGGNASTDSEGLDVLETADGNILGLGSSKTGANRDIYAYKIKPRNNSSFLFSHSLGLTGSNYSPKDATNAPNDTYAIVGERESGGSLEGFFILLDKNGNLKSGYPKTYSSTLQTTFRAIEAIPGGFYAIGQSNNDPSGDLFLLKTDLMGNPQSGFPINIGDPGVFENANDLLVLPSGELLVAGVQGNDAMLMKLKASGSVLWTQTFGGPGVDIFNSVSTTPDGGIVATGTRNNVLYLVKTDSNGNL